MGKVRNEFSAMRGAIVDLHNMMRCDIRDLYNMLDDRTSVLSDVSEILQSIETDLGSMKIGVEYIENRVSSIDKDVGAVESDVNRVSEAALALLEKLDSAGFNTGPIERRVESLQNTVSLISDYVWSIKVSMPR